MDSLPNLVGTWRLVSYEARASSGEARYPLGQHVIGQLFYGVDGNMSAHVMRIDRPTFASNDPGSGTDEEVREAFEGHVSYFGTYTVDPTAHTVTHRVRGASYPNWGWSRSGPLLSYRRSLSRLVHTADSRARRVTGVHPNLGTHVMAEVTRSFASL